MTRAFPALDLSSAPASARPLLEGSLKKFGKIPSPLARLALGERCPATFRTWPGS